MKYKIQAKCVWGWGDLKYSEDNGGTYHVDLYETEEEAKKELKCILDEILEDENSYRIVTEDVLEDFNIYAE
jgi:hypothetical protein